jgi:hypothetical protein
MAKPPQLIPTSRKTRRVEGDVQLNEMDVDGRSSELAGHKACSRQAAKAVSDKLAPVGVAWSRTLEKDVTGKLPWPAHQKKVLQ